MMSLLRCLSLHKSACQVDKCTCYVYGLRELNRVHNQAKLQKRIAFQKPVNIEIIPTVQINDRNYLYCAN